MNAPLSLAACLGLMCHVAVAAEQAAAEPSWLVDANGCKFLDPSSRNQPPVTTEWTGQCVAGFVSGPGEVRVGPWQTFRGEFSQGRIVKGSMETAAGEVFEGAFLDNRLHGDVAVRTLDGTSIKAQFDRGRLKGEHADIAWANGARYRGEIDPRSRFSHGKGFLEYADGSAYDGEFKQGRLEGAGVMKSPDGEVRFGTFVNGELNGHGWILYANQSRYEGELRMGQPSGIGRVEMAGGGLYEGGFVAGKYQGKGKLKYGDGGSYEGEFLAGEPHGSGTMTWPDGNRYVGQFLNGKRHGTGQLTQPTGEWEEGEWKVGVLSGKCHIVDHENVYDGQCLDGKRSGRGREEDKARQLVYEGEFSKDRYDGKGSLHVGELAYEGTFKGGVMDGPGTLSVGQATMHGDFKSGVMVRGTINANDGRTFEVDIERDEILEVMKDGSKRPVDELPADITI